MKEVIFSVILYEMSFKILLAYFAGIYTATVYDCKPYVSFVEKETLKLKDSFIKHIEDYKKNDQEQDKKKDSVTILLSKIRNQIGF